jgi:hypothetical protein
MVVTMMMPTAVAVVTAETMMAMTMTAAMMMVETIMAVTISAAYDKN